MYQLFIKRTLLALVLVIATTSTPAAAQSTSTSELYETIKTLTAQVETLTAQIRQRGQITVTPAPDTVRRIQSVLREDPSLYPEGLVTGFYGPLTVAALERLQTRYGLPATGSLDTTTLAVLDTLSSTSASSTNICTHPILQKTRFCTSIPEDPAPSSSVPTATTDGDYLNTGYETLLNNNTLLEYEGVTIRRDLAYGDKAAEKFDLYRPEDTSLLTSLPTIIMVHGGGWKRGDKRMDNILGSKVEYFTGRDYNFISINYPLENIDPEEQVESVARAMKYFQRNARRLGIDTSKMVLMGHSAGAHLVSLLTADRNLRREFRISPWQGTIALDSAGYNIPAMMEANHLPTIYEPAFGDDPDFWQAMSPYHQYRGTAEDFLLVCSTTRPDDACGEAKKFMEKVVSVTRSKSSATLFPQDLNHAEINNQIGVAGEYTDAIQDFLTQHTLP